MQRRTADRNKLKRESSEERFRKVLKQRILLGVLAVLLVLYLVISLYYMGHFLPNTSVNSIDVSGMSYKQASQAMKNLEGIYSLTLEGPLESTEHITADTLSLQIVGTSGLKKCIRSQGGFFWISKRFAEKRVTADISMQYDGSALETAISRLDMLNEDLMKEPVNAKLEQQGDGSVEIAAEQPGTELNVEKCRAAIREAVANGRDTVDLSVFATQPVIYRDDANLLLRKEQWNRYMRSSGIVFRVDGHNIELDGTKIAELLEDDGETVTLSESKVAQMIAVWKDLYDTYKRSYSFTTYSGETVMLYRDSDYGYELNDEEALEIVCSKLEAGEDGFNEMTYWHRPLYDTNNGFGGNYVEISLNDQHLWLWKNGEVILDTDIVSGMPVYGRVTYMGCFSIKKKQTDVTLGDIEIEGYSTPVKYWAPFNGGEGLHDAYWRSEFGGSIWKYDGSHGCINIPKDVMPVIYENIEVGEAVVIYGDDYDNSVYHKETQTDSDTDSVA